MIEIAIFLGMFSLWLMMAAAFLSMRKYYLEYRGRWRKAVELMEEIQIENGRLTQSRDEALDVCRGLSNIIRNAEERWEEIDEEQQAHRQLLQEQMQAMIKQQRAERTALMEKDIARRMAKRTRSANDEIIDAIRQRYKRARVG